MKDSGNPGLDRRIARFMDEMAARTKQATRGELTNDEVLSENRDALMRARLDMSADDFAELVRQIGLESYRLAVELSEHGIALAGNDPRRPN